MATMDNVRSKTMIAIRNYFAAHRPHLVDGMDAVIGEAAAGVTVAMGELVLICEAYHAGMAVASPALTDACKDLMEFWDNGNPVHPGAEVVEELRRVMKEQE